MTFTGQLLDGAMVFTTPVTIPAGTEVRVETPFVPLAESDDIDSEMTFAERYKDVIGAVTDLPADAALNVDHYLYGHPKPTQ